MSDLATVFIIDDEKEVLESLRWLIESVGYDVKTFAHPEEFLNDYSDDQAGCLITDVRMPKMSGLQLQHLLNQENIKIPVIFITGHGDVAMTVQAMKEGAFDFQTKPINNQVLIDSINDALQRDSEIREDAKKTSKIQSRVDALTPREKEVMELMAEGLYTKNIAAQLKISPNTAELHRAKVMKKMEVKSLAELIRMLLTTNLLKTA